MNLISIILPYYKKENYIEATISSILNQTFQNFEIILIDDELTDNSKKILDKLAKLDKRISILKNPKNLGAGLSRNEGIKNSVGDFLAFCDCDDLWDKNKLKNQLKFMNDLNIDACHTSYNIIDHNEKVIARRKAFSEMKFDDLLSSCDIGLSTVMIRKKLFEDTEILFSNIKTKEDYILWLRLSERGTIFFGLDENLTNWRKLNNSLSSSIFQKISDGYKVYRKYLNYSPLKSLIRLFILSINSILR